MTRLFIFYSDWIIIWFILYKFNIVNYNPKISLLFGLIHNIIHIITIIINKEIQFNKKYISLFIHFILKIIMFYLLKDITYNLPNIIANIIIFIIYNIWLNKIHNINYFKSLGKIINKDNDNDNNIYDINKKKLIFLNNNYKKNFDEINNNLKYKLIKEKYNFNENKMNKVNLIFKNKFDKLFIKYYNNILD